MNLVTTAPALKALNLLSRREGTEAAFAYLKSEYSDAHDVLAALSNYLIDTDGDPANEDAVNAADILSKETDALLRRCEEMETA